MKNLNFWLFLIVGILFLIGSCATDESSSSSSSTSSDNSSSTTSTLSAPSVVTATLGWHQIALDWTAVSGASSYTVYWGTSTGISTSSTAITGITDDNYTHTGLDNGTTYYYSVATVNSAGTGSLSIEVSDTPRTGPTVTEACTAGEAASGTVSGLKGTTAAGTYYHSWYGASPSDGCIDNSSAISAFSSVVASGTKGVRHAAIIQSNGNAFMDSWSFYMGDNCTKQSGFMSFYQDNLTVSDNITIASNQASGYPDNATKVFTNNSRMCALAETAEQEAKLETLFGGAVSLTMGTTYDTTNGDNNSVIWTVLDNISGQSINWLYTEDNEQWGYPDNFSNSGGTTWHAGDNITR